MWTKDVTRAMRVVKAMRAGITWVNTYHPTYSEAPWGGYKQSGIGRELGTYGIDEYTELKQINIDLTDQPMGVYPGEAAHEAGAALAEGLSGNGQGEAAGDGQSGNGKVVPLMSRRPFEKDRLAEEAWVKYCKNCV